MNGGASLSEIPLPSASPVPADEAQVVVAGDWHGSIAHVGKAIPSIARNSPEVRTILQVGDFGIWPGTAGRKFLDAVDFWCARAGITRVLVTPGNHEDWGWLDREFNAHPGKPVSLSPVVEVLPRGYRFEIGHRTFSSFGGAASVDFKMRTEGIDWFPSELPTQQDVTRAVAGGHADVLLTHETVDGGTPSTESALRRNPMGWGPEALAYSSQSRELVTEVWKGVAPKLLLHGHMHLSDEVTLPSGQQVVSLGRDGQARNLALLELSTLKWKWLEDAPTGPRARRPGDWDPIS